MDVEIIDIISPPQEKGSVSHCRLNVKIRKIYNNYYGHPVFETLQNKTVESTFELKNVSMGKFIRKGNNVFIQVSQCDSDEWQAIILMETFDFSKDNKPVPFQNSSRYGYKNPKGDIIIDPLYREALPFLDTGIAAVIGNYGWEYINYAGMWIITPYVVNDRPDAFEEGLTRYKQQQYGNVYENTFHVGFMNDKGEVAIEARYKNAFPFSDGLAAVCVKEADQTECWGFIDQKGTMVIKPQFLKVFNSFKNGRAYVCTKKGQQVVINRDGEIIE